MTPEAQRIAIAEACGWKSHKDSDYPESMRRNPRTGNWENRPDYLSDLNAMHEAEKYAAEHIMDANQWENYGRRLERIHPTAVLKSTDRDEPIDYYDFATLMCELSAAQRAEAFLRTKNLWDDTK